MRLDGPANFDPARAMLASLPYRQLADAVLLLHVLVVLFVLGGLLVVALGDVLTWHWIDALWFRLLHVAVIGVVVAEAWLGFVCPLTTLEMWLRANAETVGYTGGFVEHWLRAILYWQAPPWVFTAAYSLFGLAVAASWWLHPPRPWARRHPVDTLK